LAVQGDYYFNGCWQAKARQAKGSNLGSGGQVTHRVAAVHGGRAIKYVVMVNSAVGHKNHQNLPTDFTDEPKTL